MAAERSRDYVSVSDAAKMVGVSPRTLNRWARAGRIGSQTTEDGEYVLRRSDLVKLRATVSDPPPPDA